MTRTIRSFLVLTVLLGPAAALAQAAADAKPADAAQPGPADAAKPLEAKPAPAPAPAPATLPPVLSRFNVTFYGYVNVDALYDTTRSHNEGMGNGAVAREGTQNGDKGRTIFTARNSRFGFRVAAPEYQGIKVSGLIETDFGQMYSSVAEGTYYTNGLLRLRQANFKIETPWVDLLIGQAYYLFGWQTSYFPATAAMLSVAGEPFGRSPQLRLSKTIKTAALNVDLAAGAFRPPQRDAQLPEVQGGVRFVVNNYKGTHSLGAGGTAAYPASLGVSGAYRQFVTSVVADPTPAPTYPEKKVDGYGVSFDALIPIIPSVGGNRGNTLTLVATYAITKGAGDLLGGTTGVTAVGKADAAPPAGFKFQSPDVGTVVWDDTGKPRAVEWNGLLVNADYYLPPSGRIFVSATFGQATSGNLKNWVQGPNEAAVFDRLRHWDGNVFFDVTPAARLVLSYQHRETRYVDGKTGKNDRYHASAYYFF